MPYYLIELRNGIIYANSNGDGYSINLKWNQAYPTILTNQIGYNIYMSQVPSGLESAIPTVFAEDFFNQPPSFFILDGYLTTTIQDLIPGQMYHFGVRAFEYSQTFYDLHKIPVLYNNLRVFPQSLLAANVGLTDSIIPLVDATSFPISGGTVKIGVELIQYSYVDGYNDLILTNTALQRGFNNSYITIHNIDGYDGYRTGPPEVIFWPVETVEFNTRVYECWNRFDIGNIPFTVTDGYHQRIKDILTTDLSVSDAENIGFPRYDYSGYHRTDPVLLINGTCLGSYIGGTFYCADGYSGAGMQLRGIPIQDQNNQRQEMLLTVTGEKCCLIKRQWTGITCQCMLPYNEYPQARCQYCFGTGFIIGWNQYFDPRYSDGKIYVRFSPVVDDLVPTDSGLESEMKPNCWTLTVPTIKDRDVLVRFDIAGNEEYRYEILNVTRNRMFLAMEGQQTFAVQRIRKTDPIYQVPVFYDSSLYPNILTTGVTASPPAFPFHSHTIEINEKINSLSQINQITSTTYGHSHIVQNGVVLPGVVGHTHTIILPGSQ